MRPIECGKGGWREVCTLALKATSPSEGFFAFENFTCKHCTLYIIVQYYFSPLQVKNKPRQGVKTPAFILGPVNMVANMYCNSCYFVGKFELLFLLKC
jgi:hypothetical protein